MGEISRKRDADERRSRPARWREYPELGARQADMVLRADPAVAVTLVHCGLEVDAFFETNAPTGAGLRAIALSFARALIESPESEGDAIEVRLHGVPSVTVRAPYASEATPCADRILAAAYEIARMA